MMMTERGVVAPAAGGSVLAQFDAILAAAVPELTGRVQAVKFDADTGRLGVVPDALAVGTKLRWSVPKLIAAANDTVPNAHVHAVHALAPAPTKTSPATAAPVPASQPTAPAAPVERGTSPDGYRRAIKAHRQAARPSLADPAIAEAVEWQTAAVRELSRRAFPEPDVVPDDAPAPIDQVVPRGAPALLAQTRPGGKILLTLSGWLYGYARVLLTVADDGTAERHMLGGTVSFMSARTHVASTFGTQPTGPRACRGRPGPRGTAPGGLQPQARKRSTCDSWPKARCPTRRWSPSAKPFTWSMSSPGSCPL